MKTYTTIEIEEVPTQVEVIYTYNKEDDDIEIKSIKTLLGGTTVSIADDNDLANECMEQYKFQRCEGRGN